MDDQTWHLVRSIPKVLGFIGGTSDKPAPISSKEADTILQRVQDSSDKPKPKFSLKLVKWFVLLTVLLQISMAWLKKSTTKRIDYVWPY